jgi:hypothetical protein
MGSVVSWFEEWYYDKFEREQILQTLLKDYRETTKAEVTEMMTIDDVTDTEEQYRILR